MTWRPWFHGLAAFFLSCVIGLTTVSAQNPDEKDQENGNYHVPVGEVAVAVISTMLVLLIVCRPTGKV